MKTLMRHYPSKTTKMQLPRLEYNLLCPGGLSYATYRSLLISKLLFMDGGEGERFVMNS
jgi:hypothetical protein